MPVSKKRKKKRINKPSGPPLSKSELSSRKKKITTRQILIYVFSALIILSLAISFLIGSSSPATPAHQGASGTDQGIFLATPENQETTEGSGSEESGNTPSDQNGSSDETSSEESESDTESGNE